MNEMCTCKTIYLFWPTGNFLATFCSKEQKDKWFYFLKRSIDEAKRISRKISHWRYSRKTSQAVTVYVNTKPKLIFQVHD
ncbi:mCG20277, isoform CRA_a [Mus musculus]|nr:mCG20277, isoform CRA_a [Mus musculus]